MMAEQPEPEGRASRMAAALAEAERAAQENDFPRLRGFALDDERRGQSPEEPPPEPAPAAGPTSGAGSAFTTRSLRSGRRGHLLKSRKYTLPGTEQFVYVFPATGHDFEILSGLRFNRQWLPGAGDAPDEVEAKQQAALAHVQALQVALVCYQDEERRARCFSTADVQDLKDELPYRTIQEICNISNDLAAGTETLGEGLKSFFGDLQVYCATWSSAFDGWADCPPGLREQTQALASVASSALSQGTWGSAPNSRAEG